MTTDQVQQLVLALLDELHKASMFSLLGGGSRRAALRHAEAAIRQVAPTGEPLNYLDRCIQGVEGASAALRRDPDTDDEDGFGSGTILQIVKLLRDMRELIGAGATAGLEEALRKALTRHPP